MKESNTDLQALETTLVNSGDLGGDPMTQPTALEILTANQQAASDEKWAKVNLLGNLTNWRQNFGGHEKELKRKEQILSGYQKILALCLRGK